MASDSKYLQLLEQKGISPNWWCSEEYFEYSEFKEIDSWHSSWHVISIFDGESFLVPSLFALGYYPGISVWSDFIEYNPDLLKKKFLDYEFIYDPKDFLKMEGGKWAVFRKNSRKFPRRYHKKNLVYIDCKDIDLSGVVLKWLSELPDEEVHDFDVMMRFLKEGKNRKVLVDPFGDILGINVWDENYKYVNYRYCFCENLPFLSEYMRWLFFTDPKIQEKNKLVNDGGCLGRQHLYDFKAKLNPISIREVYSWEAK